MRNAFQNAPSLRLGSKGLAVRLLQAGLIQLGHKLPASMGIKGLPDGNFGPATQRAVMDFQSKRGIEADGVAGSATIGALDAALYQPPPPPPPPPSKPVPSVETRDYLRGAGPPPYRADPGAGRWRAKKVELPYLAIYMALDAGLSVFLAFGKDATNHLRHYLRGGGTDYTIDLEGMLRSVPSARELFALEVKQARKLVELLPAGTHAITSRQTEDGYNTEMESKNWYYAIGGYQVWGTGSATVRSMAGTRRYELDFTYHFRDLYDWDGGKKVAIDVPFQGEPLVITDHFMGEFHRQGMAREYFCVGSLRRRLTWSHGAAIPDTQLFAPGAA